MMRSKSAFLLAALGALSMPAIATPNNSKLFDEGTAFEPRHRRFYNIDEPPLSRKERRRQHLSRPRYSLGIRTHVSGAKLARKAQEGTVGRAHLR